MFSCGITRCTHQPFRTGIVLKHLKITIAFIAREISDGHKRCVIPVRCDPCRAMRGRRHPITRLARQNISPQRRTISIIRGNQSPDEHNQTPPRQIKIIPALNGFLAFNVLPRQQFRVNEIHRRQITARTQHTQETTITPRQRPDQIELFFSFIDLINITIREQHPRAVHARTHKPTGIGHLERPFTIHTHEHLPRLTRKIHPRTIPRDRIKRRTPDNRPTFTHRQHTNKPNTTIKPLIQIIIIFVFRDFTRDITR